MIKQWGSDIHPVVCQTHSFVSRCPHNEYSQYSSHFLFRQMCKAVCLYKPISPFVTLSYKLLRASRKSMEHHLEENGFCFLW